MPRERGDQEAHTTTIAAPCPRSASVRRPPPTQVRSTASARTVPRKATRDSRARVRTAAPRRTREEEPVAMGWISVWAGSAAAVREMGEDAVTETVGGRTADRPLADDQQQLAGVVDLLRAVAAPSDVVLEGGQHLVVHLAIKEQEQNRVDLFTIHRPSSGTQALAVYCDVPTSTRTVSTWVCGGKFPGDGALVQILVDFLVESAPTWEWNCGCAS